MLVVAEQEGGVLTAPGEGGRNQARRCHPPVRAGAGAAALLLRSRVLEQVAAARNPAQQLATELQYPPPRCLQYRQKTARNRQKPPEIARKSPETARHRALRRLEASPLCFVPLL